MAESAPAASPPQPSLVSSALRHPLAAVIVGFTLTGVVGTMLSNHMSYQRQQELEATRMRDARRTAVRDMARALSERLLRMQMVVTAILRHAPPEVVADLKKSHDEAEAKWFLVRPEVMILAREVIGESDYEAMRADMENRMVRKRLTPLRECLQEACAKVAEGGDGVAVLTNARAAEMLRELDAGTEALVDGLYDLASITQLSDSDPQAIRVRQRVRQQMERACP